MNNHGEASSSYFEEDQEEEANLSPTQLLKLAETHLRVRNFSLCRNYILEFQQQQQQPKNPNFPSNNLYASQLLTISNILSNPTDYYSILQITPFCNDFNLIRSQFNHIISLIDPIKDKISVGNEALNLVRNAYGCLSDSTKKTQFDSQYVSQRSDSESVNFDVGTFWTFCPYCFYMYQFPRVYEGCCLRCQNDNCGRAFHGVAVNSLPKMELDKGVYFNCFGYFPLGFSPQSENTKKGSGKFDSWSPIVGMFPVQKIGKTHNGGMNMNGVDYEGFSNGDYVEVLDESDDESGNGQGVRGVNAGNSQSKKQKTVPSSARKLTSRGGKGNDGGSIGVNGYGEEGGYGNDGNFNIGDGNSVGVDDMAFFEEDGEIFVGLGADDAL